jgi:hypothetical protein
MAGLGLAPCVHVPENPISISAAPGWRALFLTGEPPHWHAEPLAGWAVFQVNCTTCGMATEIHGLVRSACGSGQVIWAACYEFGFWRYLGPGEPDLTPGQAAREWERWERERREAAERAAGIPPCPWGQAQGGAA